MATFSVRRARGTRAPTEAARRDASPYQMKRHECRFPERPRRGAALPGGPLGGRESIKEAEQPQRYLVAGANLHVVVCDIALWQVLYLVSRMSTFTHSC